MSDRSSLTIPTDLDILDILSTGRRQTPANIGAHLDRDQDYMGTRLRFLRDLGYLRYAPPADRSGMFEITPAGLVASWHRDQYVRDHHDDFHNAVLTAVEKQPDGEILPDLVWVDTEEKYGFIALTEQDTVIPSELADDPEALPYDHEKQGFRPEYTGEVLYMAYFHGIAERVGGIEAYRLSDRGELVHDLVAEKDVTDPVELTERVRETYTVEENERLDRLNRAYEITRIDS